VADQSVSVPMTLNGLERVIRVV